MKHNPLSALGLLATIACGHSGDSNGAFANSSAQTEATGAIVSESLTADLELLARKRTYFGHQSVGFNLLDGVADLTDEAEFKSLDVIETNEIDAQSPAGVYHARVGVNTNPKSKIDAFVADLRSMSTSPPDLALLKLCYIDFDQETDVEDLFSYYQNAVEQIKQNLPDITVVHVTAPLTMRRMDLKSRVKRLLGREDPADGANVKRNIFNQRLKDAFGTGPVFDLAKVESTRPDGSRVEFSRGSMAYLSLEPSYTNDGGHLNQLGRTRAAAEMIRVLADAVREGRTDDAY